MHGRGDGAAGNSALLGQLPLLHFAEPAAARRVSLPLRECVCKVRRGFSPDRRDFHIATDPVLATGPSQPDGNPVLAIFTEKRAAAERGGSGRDLDAISQRRTRFINDYGLFGCFFLFIKKIGGPHTGLSKMAEGVGIFVANHGNLVGHQNKK